MIRPLLCTWLLLAGCRTQPLAPFDLGGEAALDLARARGAPDLATAGARDLASAEAPDFARADAAAPPTARLLAPLSTARASSRRPHLRWTANAAVEVDLCPTRDCLVRLATVNLDRDGGGGVPAIDLPPGVIFWRLRPAGSTLAITPTWELFIPSRSAPFDAARGTTLDVNGDGYADLAIAAQGPRAPGGTVYLYLGGPGGLAATPMAIHPVDDVAYFGTSLASAGDVNGDGYGDLLVSAVRTLDGISQRYVARAYVYLGGPAGLEPQPRVAEAPPVDADLDQQLATVAPVGDVDGDGYGDVAIGSPYFTDGAYHQGQTALFFGGADALAPTPTLLGGAAGTRAHLGIALAGADLDGDGYSDVIAGAPGLEPTIATPLNRVYIYWGKKGGVDAGSPLILDGPSGDYGGFGRTLWTSDSDGDGHPELWAQDLPVVNDRFGPCHVFSYRFTGRQPRPPLTMPAPGTATAFFGSPGQSGDLDGDGYDDIAIGDWNAAGANQQPAVGRVYVYFGGAAGTGTPLALDGFDGAYSDFGLALATGDVDGDGRAELAVSAPSASDSAHERYAGRVYLFAGSAMMPWPPPLRLDGLAGASGYFGAALGL
jgi:hypothetical protein